MILQSQEHLDLQLIQRMGRDGVDLFLLPNECVSASFRTAPKILFSSFSPLFHIKILIGQMKVQQEKQL